MINKNKQKVPKILFVFGTRPEAIKMAPLIKMFTDNPKFTVIVVVTGQHDEMLIDVLKTFEIKPHYNLKVMQPGQRIIPLMSKMLRKLGEVYELESPDFVFVHGDTSTTICASIAASMIAISVVHIEAGLRSFDINNPFPEELNRKIVSQVSSLHFAPTQQNKNNLLQEGINESTIHVVGNTVIDALLMMSEKLDNSKSVETVIQTQLKNTNTCYDSARHWVFVTCHRRENHGKPLEAVCEALQRLASSTENIQIFFPVHPNPNVRKIVNARLKNTHNICLLPPLDYKTTIAFLKRTEVVLTDSGGLQEEAPSLGIPVLLLRNVSERQEAVDAGTVKIIGTSADLIVSETLKLLSDKEYKKSFKNSKNPYGNGDASQHICKIMEDLYYAE